MLPWAARSPDLSPIENMGSTVAQRLTQITPPAATPDQLWQRVEAAWSAIPQERIQSLFESMPRRVAPVISNNSGYSSPVFRNPRFADRYQSVDQILPVRTRNIQLFLFYLSCGIFFLGLFYFL
ncbi:transposable element Tcb1 transposase [Trichonephila clavipes]|nr:transposable element Tcb1 transposase [Trichonephila clavipes]